MSVFFLREFFFDLRLDFFAFLELFDRLDDLFKAFFFLLFFSLDDEVDEVKDGDKLTSELEILDEELDSEAELLDEEFRVFTFWLGFFEGFATQKNLVHLPENRFWNPKSESRIIENDVRIQK